MAHRIELMPIGQKWHGLKPAQTLCDCEHCLAITGDIFERLEWWDDNPATYRDSHDREIRELAQCCELGFVAFQCDRCGDWIRSRSDLDAHIARHKGDDQ